MSCAAPAGTRPTSLLQKPSCLSLAPLCQHQSPFPGSRCTPEGPSRLGTELRANRLHFQPGAAGTPPARAPPAQEHQTGKNGPQKGHSSCSISSPKAIIVLTFPPCFTRDRAVHAGLWPPTQAAADRGCFRQAAVCSGARSYTTIIFLNILHCFIEANIKYLLLGLASVLILHNCSTVYFI